MGERVKLNVGGIRYETCLSTMQQFPDTLLGTMFDPRNDHILKKDENGEVFFDRNGKIFSLILDFYRTGGQVSPFASTKYSKQSIQAEVDFFQLPCASAEDMLKDEDKEVREFGERIQKKALEKARGAVDDHLYTLLLRQIRQALNHAAEHGLNAITVKISCVGQTHFGADPKQPIYMITNVGAKDIFEIATSYQLLLHDLSKMGLKPIPAEKTENINLTWRLKFVIFE